MNAGLPESGVGVSAHGDTAAWARDPTERADEVTDVPFGGRMRVLSGAQVVQKCGWARVRIPQRARCAVGDDQEVTVEFGQAAEQGADPRS